MYRKDGTSVFLHPFRTIDKLHSNLTKGEILGHYGHEPRVESLTMFRNELYRLVEQEVKSWVADSRFIPRFVISAGIFLLLYLFLGFVIRDPLPIIDEIAIALGGSILAYILLGRKDMQSEAALKRRIELRKKVDTVVFSESAFVRRVEEVLAERENDSAADLIDQIQSESTLSQVEGYEDELRQMVDYLDRMFASSEYRQMQKRLKRLPKDTGGRSRESLQRWLEKQKIDVPLLSVYLDLKRKVK
ncbi:MAG: hypothetical protein ACOC8L_08755 [Spirochaetota bacterium]